MKVILFTVGALVSITGFSQISDSVALGAGYINESYYSFENGEVANVDNNNWDLGFDLSGFGGTIRLNRRISTMWVYPGSTADWATLDTSGMTSWETYTDTYDYWDEGAFNNCANVSDPADMGWGLYNSSTHFVNGERLFVVELNNGDYKKLFIELLAAGTYTFKYDNLDNTNEVSETLVKSDYSGKNFVYYSLENEAFVDREPLSDSWDIVFTNVVLELAPDYFGGVTYALHNKGVVVSEVSGVPSSSATYGNFEDQINTIGSDWKTFDMGLMQYQIKDSLTYFVQTTAGDVWKLVFTGFNGGSDGKIFFTKEQVEFANVPDQNSSDLKMYPNPADHLVTVQIEGMSIQSAYLYNMSGQLVFHDRVTDVSENLIISTESLQDGVYMLNLVTQENELKSYKLIVKH